MTQQNYHREFVKGGEAYEPWCAWCVMERGRAKPHLQRPVESVKIPEFEMDFCHLLQDPKQRQTSAW